MKNVDSSISNLIDSKNSCGTSNLTSQLKRGKQEEEKSIQNREATRKWNNGLLSSSNFFFFKKCFLVLEINQIIVIPRWVPG